MTTPITTLAAWCGGLTFWDWERIILQIIIVSLLYRSGKVLQKLLQDGQHDRAAREAVITDLRETAATLAIRTEKILASSEARADDADKRLDTALTVTPQAIEKLDKIEAHTKETAETLKQKL